MRKLYALLFLCCLSVTAWGQTVVSGTVTDSGNGEAVEGATVMEKGTTNGVFTDGEGKFSLTVESVPAVLEIRFIGYSTQEIETSGGTVDVSLEVDELMLDEVVVTAIGIRREKKQLGYSVQTVGGDDLRRANEVNAIQSIAGKVAGVQVTQSSGSPGGASYIRIRGSNSLTGQNQPLIVVDGVPYNNDQLTTGNPDDGSNNLLASVALSNRGIDINPADIETMTVLKGPNATALYGIAAANGAIVITTKKGSGATGGAKVNVTYNASLSLDKVNALPELQSSYAQGTGWYDFDSEGNPVPTWYGPEYGWLTSWGPSIDTLYWDGQEYDYDSHGAIVGQSDPNAGEKVTPYDNLGSFFQTGVNFNHNLALSGGSASTTYRLSVGDQNVTGIVPNSTFRRTSVRITTETALSRKLTSTTSVNYTKSGGTRTQQGSNTSGLMLGLLRTPPTFDNANGSADPVNDEASYLMADGTQRNYRGGGGYDNPYWTVNRTPFTDNVNRVFGFTSLNYKATDWMSVFYRIGTDFYSDRRKQIFAIGSRTVPAGQIFEDQHANGTLNSDLWLTFNRQFTEDLDGSLLIGHNAYISKYSRVYTQGDGFNFPDFYHISNAQSVLTREATENYRKAAIFFDAKVGWKSFLFLNITGRNEYSSTLPSDKRSFFYPSTSLGFVFTEALGMADNKILPYGKLRVSYAIVGNDAPTYALQNYFTSSSIGDGWTNGIKFPINGVAGFAMDDVMGNPNLRPERTTSLEIGTDLRFLNNRVGLDFTYYSSTTTDQILAVPIAASSGWLSAILNAGTVTNKGVEIVLNATPVKSNSFRWDIQLNFSKNKNMVVELAEGVENVFLGGFEGSAVRNVAGQPFGQIYGGTWLRDDNGNVVIENDTNSFFYGYPIASGEEGVIGDPNPDWLAGLRNTLTYKGFSLSFLIDVRKGGDIWNGTQGALTFFGMSALTENRGTTTTFEGVAGTVDGDGNIVSDGSANTAVVELNEDWYTDNGGGFGIVSEHFVQDGSFVKLREISLGYSLPASIVEKTPFQAIDLGVAGRNFILWTPYEGIDPETNLMGAVNAQGLDYFNMPNTKSYIFSLGLSF